MHGVDWAATRQRYEALLPYVSHRFDLTYVLGEMVGDLCCSHTYIGGGEYPDIPSSKVGLLGVEFEIDHYNTRIRIKRILEGQNWDDDVRSPLTEPGVDVNEGDYLLAIDGKEIFADTNPYALTLNTVGKELKLTVNDKPTMKGAREVTVKPIASESSLRYYNWVQKNHRHVDSLSDGQIGYLHIPDMGGYGLVQFAKMFYNQLRQPGLIIDVRYNGGGFVSQLIIERLRRITVGMTVGRDYPPGRMPGAGLNAHMITLLNEYSCSDGDLFPYYFREFDLGPLMGKRSWGGVVGISGQDGLLDGGYYTVPRYTFYDLEGNWVVENIGVVPDREVANPPDRSVRGFDDQLDEAIKYIKTKMAAEPKTLPARPGPPTPR
jgi:tricorn protease